MLKRIDSVLLVEDDRITNFLNERLLRKLNITDSIKVTTNGEEALQYLQNAEASGKPLPDLILLDINMPVMDGLEFLQKYNKISSFHQKGIVVVMLTTSTNTRDMDTLLYSGNTDFLSKPLTEEKIISIVNKYFMTPSYQTA